MQDLTVVINCRDAQVRAKKENELARLELAQADLRVNQDYFQLLNAVVQECRTDYALVVHDDVYLPWNVNQRAAEAVARADQAFGRDAWGVLGNAGLEVCSHRVIRFLKDPILDIVPFATARPVLTSYLDGNTLLLNVRNLRRAGVRLPDPLFGFHFYDFILTIESYRSGLVCAADPSLYVLHQSSGSQTHFDAAAASPAITDYFTGRFTNHTFHTLNGDVHFASDLSYLRRGASAAQIDYYGLVWATAEKVLERLGPKRLVVAVRTRLERLPRLRRLLDTLFIGARQNIPGLDLSVLLSVNHAVTDAKPVIAEIQGQYAGLTLRAITDADEDETGRAAGGKRFPRVAAIARAVRAIPQDENTFIWFMDDDDFIMPTNVRQLACLLEPGSIFVGDSQEFAETWAEGAGATVPENSVPRTKYLAENYPQTLTGVNSVPFSSVIYPAPVLAALLKEYELAGDYFEDYALFMLAMARCPVRAYPLLIAGISQHGANTVLEKDRTHWHYSYATFFSEVVNRGAIPKAWHDFAQGSNALRLQEDLQRTKARLAEISGSITFRTVQRLKRTPIVMRTYYLFKPFLLLVAGMLKKLRPR